MVGGVPISSPPHASARIVAGRSAGARRPWPLGLGPRSRTQAAGARWPWRQPGFASASGVGVGSGAGWTARARALAMTCGARAQGLSCKVTALRLRRGAPDGWRCCGNGGCGWVPFIGRCHCRYLSGRGGWLVG
ncbi:uncharacterized protein K452DRAFT_116975 [Aplosporella prunicola CBS 121167]|uniref:Uncharacterized protein n=1 Tax=Aplosporella prunicola CBS 121167 TaxID=1176127 RepID=A0A6A6AYQ4_9PEZI|nr:uncharacterized protein K452DRAFT_116975 [Aplosporella prunicola CBS 121167]KAF2136910.1 hypothetical protein K452DRAFT_116975 [Aplosporella prunicola CBS 121167]